MAKRVDYRNDIKKLDNDSLLKKIDHLWNMLDYGGDYFKRFLYCKELAKKRGLIK